VLHDVLQARGETPRLYDPEAVSAQVLPLLRPWQRRAWVEGDLCTPFEALTWADPRYPAALRDAGDAPPVLFVEGCVEALGPMEQAVAVVGSRRVQREGFSATSLLAHRLAQGGRTIVSGLALGVDAAAHDAALRAGGRTVAVLGHGLAYTSPRVHRRLRARIVEAGGAVVSSFPDTMEAQRYTFPRRNRWIAALAAVTVVTQAATRSGARITAVEAAKLGRSVRAYRGQGRAFDGCRALIEEGAEGFDDPEALAAALCSVEHVPCAPWLRMLFDGRTVAQVADHWGGTERALSRELVRLELEGVVVRLPQGRYAPGRGLAWHTPSS
jgi:DNA processing protein